MQRLIKEELEVEKFLVKNPTLNIELEFDDLKLAKSCLEKNIKDGQVKECKDLKDWSLQAILYTGLEELITNKNVRVINGIKIPSEFDWLEMNPQFEKALDVIFNKKENLMLLGRAGSGKSEFLNLCRVIDDQSVVLAPTGIAATKVGGQTIHSFFRLPPEIVVPEKISINKETREKLRNVKRIFIDETSMIRSDVFSGIDYILKSARGDFDKPFGGCQVIIIGDLFQIPPVLKRGAETTYITENYNGAFFFNTFSFRNGEFSKIEFSKIYRQKDEIFSSALSRIREGEHTKKDLELINSRVMLESSYIEEVNDRYIYLSCLNRDVDKINQSWLDILETEHKVYNAKIFGKAKASNFQEPEILELKIGATIIMTSNEQSGFWMNGDMGVVEGFGYDPHDGDYIKVKVNRNKMIYRVFKVKREQIEYKYEKNPKTNKKELIKDVVGAFTQFPMKLAFSISVHKAQGQTFEKSYLDLGRSWENGQVYVALSRCKTLEGLGLKKKIEDKDIRVNQEVKDFVKNLRTSRC